MGGWKNNPENTAEYQDIILHSLKSFLPMILLDSFKETFRQLKRAASFSGLDKYDDNYAVFRSLQRHYSSEFNQFMNGKQQAGNVRVRILPLDEKITQRLFVVSAIIVLVVCLSGKHYFLAGVLFSVFIFLVLNAAVVGFTGGASGRYQGRVLWLIPYFVFLVVTSLLIKRRNKVLPHQIVSMFLCIFVLFFQFRLPVQN